MRRRLSWVVSQARVTVHGHEQIGLGENRPKDMRHAVLAAEGETPGVGAAE